MRKIYLLLCFFFCAREIFAQQITLIAGVNGAHFLQTYTVTNNSNQTETNRNANQSGFHVGALLGFDVGMLTIQPGLLYSVKGNQNTDIYFYNGGSNGTSYDNTITKETIGYLELPLNILYNISLKKVGKFFIGGGPYLAYGITGKDKETSVSGSNYQGSASANTYSETNGLSFGNNAGDIKNPDVGLNAIVGFKFKNRISITATYGFGLTNLATPYPVYPVYYTVNTAYPNAASTVANPNKYSNRTLSFSLGYSFL